MRARRMNMNKGAARPLAIIILLAAACALTLGPPAAAARQGAQARPGATAQPGAPGLTEMSLTVGMLLPAGGALAEMGRAMRAAVAAYFEDLNARGGVHGRKLELKAAEDGATPAETAANLGRLLDGGQVFALTASMTAGADREIGELLAARGAPLVGAVTLTPRAGEPPNRQVFYLTPGVAEQARALANFAARRLTDRAATVGVIGGRDELGSQAAGAFADQWKRAGRSAPVETAYARGQFDAAAAVAGLKGKGAQGVFFAGAGPDAAAFVAESARQGWFPQVYLLGVLAPGDILNAPAGFLDKIFVAYPAVPADITAEGLALYRGLAEKHKLPASHRASQLSALAAARVLVEGLTRAGRDVTRERLVAALEGLYDFDTGLAPRVTFGPRRRVGAMGAHVVGVDVEKKQYAPAGGWVGVDSK